MKPQDRHRDADLHVRGQSQYVDDVLPPSGMLHAVVFGSPIAHGRLMGTDLDAARAADGVVAVVTLADIPGNPIIGPIIQDEWLLANDLVAFIGQPIALIVAETREQAVAARHLATAEIEPLPVVVDPRAAFAAGDLVFPARTFSMGDVDRAWDSCETVVEGSCSIGGQEHIPLETNRARALPREDGGMTVWSSTQSPYAGQKAVAAILGIAENRVEIDVKRLGGGFGGKEDQATHWACMAALAAHVTQRPVEIVLDRGEDIQATGKRHPYECDFRLGLDREGKILAYQAEFYQNSGAYADLSMPVLERSLLHATNAYFIPNAKVMAVCCRTNLPPNTAFRGFGGPQAMFVIEAALAKAAEATGLPRDVLQQRNLLSEGDELYYGQTMERVQARATWEQAAGHFDLAAIQAAAAAHNAAGGLTRKGVAVMPICFGISFTKTFLNQGSALVHIYTDGSVGITTGGIEMGQGVSTNMIRIAAQCFGIQPERVRVESTNTTRIANMSPSAASATSDLNGNAVLLACEQLLESLTATASEQLGAGEIGFADEVVTLNGEPSELDWPGLVLQTWFARRRLSAHGFYATPDLHFDGEAGKGRPFAYHVYGTCITEVTVDCLRGTYTVDACKIVHDLGRSINPLVDLGQVEGGLMQGLGWMTMEDLVFDEEGRCRSGYLSTYKVPDVYFAPDVMDVQFLEAIDNPTGPLGSKAVGEPPLMYGIGVFFALQEAMQHFRPDAVLPFASPMTPERVLTALYDSSTVEPS